MTGFGQAGLEGDTAKPCTDPVAQAMGGMSWVTGEKDGPPYAVGGGIGDTATSIVGATAVLAALVGRQRTGLGVHIDLSMVESLAYLDCTALPTAAMSDGRMARTRTGQQNNYTFPMGPFKASDGYLALQASGVGPDSPWGRLCGLMGREDLLEDPRLVDDAHRVEHADELIKLIEHWLASLGDRDVALALLASERISSGPILSHTDMLEHPFFVQRGMFAPVEYPGIGPVTMVQPPFSFSDGKAFVKGPAPEMGEHSRQLVADVLGRDEDEIDRLMSIDALFESEGARERNRQPMTESVPAE
jgi:CoA:oxalate CoA-transferase